MAIDLLRCRVEGDVHHPGRLGVERLGSVLVDTTMVRAEKIYLSLGHASQQ